MEATLTKRRLSVSALLNEYLDYCTSVRGYSKWTMTTKTTHLKQFVTYLDSCDLHEPASITNSTVDDYMREYLETHTQNTTNTARRIIRTFLKWVYGYKEIDLKIKTDDIRLVKIRDELPKSLPTDVIKDAIDACDDKQDKLLIALLFEAGLRISEAVSIRCQEVGPTIRVVGKGNIVRVVYISDDLHRQLQSFMRLERSTGDFLFINRYQFKDRPMSPKTAARRVQVAFRRVGVSMTSHQLRHSLAVHLLENGADIFTIQKVLGHTDISTTMTYLRVKNSFISNRYNQHLGGSILQ